jgi:hypothetical protein
VQDCLRALPKQQPVLFLASTTFVAPHVDVFAKDILASANHVLVVILFQSLNLVATEVPGTASKATAFGVANDGFIDGKEHKVVFIRLINIGAECLHFLFRTEQGVVIEKDRLCVMHKQ